MDKEAVDGPLSKESEITQAVCLSLASIPKMRVSVHSPFEHQSLRRCASSRIPILRANFAEAVFRESFCAYTRGRP